MTRLTLSKAYRWRQIVAYETNIAHAYRREFSWLTPWSADISRAAQTSGDHL